MSGHAKMPHASRQVSATSLKLLIQQIHPHVRVERDSGMCVARDLNELWGRSPYTRTDPFCRDSSEQPPGKGLAPRPHPENPVGNSVWPREVLHGDHQLVRIRATVRLMPPSPAVAASPLCSLVVTCLVQKE